MPCTTATSCPIVHLDPFIRTNTVRRKDLHPGIVDDRDILIQIRHVERRPKEISKFWMSLFWRCLNFSNTCFVGIKRTTAVKSSCCNQWKLCSHTTMQGQAISLSATRVFALHSELLSKPADRAKTITKSTKFTLNFRRRLKFRLYETAQTCNRLRSFQDGLVS